MGEIPPDTERNPNFNFTVQMQQFVKHACNDDENVSVHTVFRIWVPVSARESVSSMKGYSSFRFLLIAVGKIWHGTILGIYFDSLCNDHIFALEWVFVHHNRHIAEQSFFVGWVAMKFGPFWREFHASSNLVCYLIHACFWYTVPNCRGCRHRTRYQDD